jgi:hypothetical protein
MATTTTPQTENEDSQTRRSLLFGMIVWFVHLNVAYNLASLACTWGWLSFTLVGISGLQLIEAIITLVTLLLMLFLIYLPWREWRRFQTEAPPSNPQLLEDTEKNRRPLVAFIVMLLNSFFFLFVIALFVPIFALSACSQS